MHLSCDTMVALGNATKNGQTIFAKNSDRPADECQPLVLRPRQKHRPGTTVCCQFVELPQVEVIYRHVGSRPYWCWGYEHGFNEHQVVIGNEALSSKLAPSPQAKLIGMELVRLGLERARTAAEAVDVMSSLITRFGQGKFDNEAGVRTYDNGFIVADNREAYVLETAGHEWAVKRVERTEGISNVHSVERDWAAISPEAESGARERGWWPAQGEQTPFNFAEAYSSFDRSEGSGAERRARSCALLSHRRGQIDARTMIDILSDHGAGSADPASFASTITPSTGICVHGNLDGAGGNTAASLVADLCADGSRLPIYWCSFYSPCLGLFFPIFLEGELPSRLSVGGKELTTESPWWRFHQLSIWARSDNGISVDAVREIWADLQARLFDSAYEFAKEGQRLIQRGKSETASEMLSRYMGENIEAMLRTIERYENRRMLEAINDVYADGPNAEEADVLQQQRQVQRRLIDRQW